MKALIVGQAPSQDTDGQRPFTGRSGAHLAAILGVAHVDLPRAADLVNLLQRWPGKADQGDRFPKGEARAAAEMLLAIAPHDRIVACGSLVVAALGLGGMEPLQRRTVAGKVVLHLPHPSGLNRWWNDPANEADARVVLRRFVSASVTAAV